MKAFLKSRIVKICLASCIITAAVVAAGCDDPNYVTSPHYRYGIHVMGIENYSTASGMARILVPIPMYGDKPLLPFNGAAGENIYAPSGYGAYDSNIVVLNDYGYHVVRSLSVNDTPDGPMLDIIVNETDFYDFYSSSSSLQISLPVYRMFNSSLVSPEVSPLGNNTYRYVKPSPGFDEIRVHITDMLGPVGSVKANDTVMALRSKPLNPDAHNEATPYTLYIDGAKESNQSYASYIFLDPSLRPIGPNKTIELYAVFEVIVGDRPYGGPGDHNVYVIRESIPSSVTGFIPVKVQYAGHFREYSVEDRWGPTISLPVGTPVATIAPTAGPRTTRGRTS